MDKVDIHPLYLKTNVIVRFNYTPSKVFCCNRSKGFNTMNNNPSLISLVSHSLVYIPLQQIIEPTSRYRYRGNIVPPHPVQGCKPPSIVKLKPRTPCIKPPCYINDMRCIIRCDVLLTDSYIEKYIR